MTRWLWLAPLFAIATVTGCATAVADDESLRDSFAERIQTSSFVSNFARSGDELTFAGPAVEGTDGTTAQWRVVIDTSLVEPNEFDDAMPYVGRLTSQWYADGELVEFLGSMTAVPSEFLERGLAQECFAYWVAGEARWDW